MVITPGISHTSYTIELAKQGYKMEVMDKWSKEMEIQFTPTIFINDYQLPSAYNIEELQYFLLE